MYAHIHSTGCTTFLHLCKTEPQLVVQIVAWWTARTCIHNPSKMPTQQSLYEVQCINMVATKKHTVTLIAAQRVKVFETYAQTNDAKVPRSVSGYMSKNTKSRSVKKLKEDHTLGDKPRPGRPVTITQDALDRAMELLVSQETPLLTGEDLLHLLQDDGLVPAQTIRETLMKHLRTHVKSLGHQLISIFRGTLLPYCKVMLRPWFNMQKNCKTISSIMGLTTSGLRMKLRWRSSHILKASMQFQWHKLLWLCIPTHN